MKTLKHILLILILLLIGSAIMVGGCSIKAKKPVQSKPNIPSTPGNTSSPPPVPKGTVPSPIAPGEVSRQAVINANQVIGVKEATAFVEDRVLYLGLELKANVDKDKKTAIETEVKDRVSRITSGYIVRLTSDKNTVALIKTVAQGVSEGKSVSEYNYEIHNITIRLTPKGT